MSEQEKNKPQRDRPQLGTHGGPGEDERVAAPGKSEGAGHDGRRQEPYHPDVKPGSDAPASDKVGPRS
jgi:hypothetical protein